MHKKSRIFLPVFILIAFSLACGSIQLGVVTPTSETDLTPVADAQEPILNLDPTKASLQEAEPEPTDELDEDFSHLWIEYWDPKFDYGVALPSHWEVNPTPIQGENGAMTAFSYDEEFFRQNAIRGHWIDGGPPEGAVKVDFYGLEGILAQQETEVALNEELRDFGTILLSIEETTLGSNTAYKVTHADQDGPGETWDSYAFRIKPEVILMVIAYPHEAIQSQDIQSILASLSFSKQEPINKPEIAPFPPFEYPNQNGVYPTATQAIAWGGRISSLPENELYDDIVVLFPEGAGEYGIKGATPEIEAEIVSLRDATGEDEVIRFWGNFFCNYADYNGCRLAVNRLEYGEQAAGKVEAVSDLLGVIRLTSFNDQPAYVFELAEPVPVWYGVTGGDDPELQSQIEALSDTETQVKVWGDLHLGVLDISGARIEITRVDPSGPGGMPTSAACESGYMGTAQEAVEVIQYSLEIGNWYPFSYLIGNPFVIGYWQSEGIAIPRAEAYTMLENELLPSPEEVVVIDDPNMYPDLQGISIDSLWGPDVDVAASLYSLGWGPDGQGEAIIVIARCAEGEYNAYFWYGMLYAGNGF